MKSLKILNRYRCILVSLVTVVCTSCSKAPESTTSPIEPEAVSEISLEIANAAKVSEILEANRGNVVLVDYWQTSCVPCVEKLPKVVEMGKRLADRGLVVVTLSLDDPDAKEEIREFLKGRGATGKHFISQFGTSPQSLDEFEINLVPVYRLYDRKGELVKTFEETGPESPLIEMENIEAEIEKLL